MPLLATLLLVACTREHLVEDPVEDTGPEPLGLTCLEEFERACPPDSPLTWSNFAEPLFSEHCLDCHDYDHPNDTALPYAPGELDFSFDWVVFLNADRIYAQAADENTAMPLIDDGGMTPEERVLLGDWLACCMPGL